MEIKKELELIQAEKATNEKHVQDWRKGNMKDWIVHFAFIEADGTKREWEPDDETGYNADLSDFQFHVDAPDIQGALDEGKKQLLAMAHNRNWQETKITEIGIWDDEIW